MGFSIRWELLLQINHNSLKLRHIRCLLVNGFACKDPKLVTASDFFFSGLHLKGNTSNAMGSKGTLVTVAQLPGLNTLGISMARIDFAPWGINPPHTHPRATEILTIIEGTIQVGFITSNPENRLITKVLQKGDVFVFPQGLVHFQRNIGNGNVVGIAGLSSQNPGVNTIGNAVFGANPDIPDDLLAKAFQVDSIHTMAEFSRKNKEKLFDLEYVRDEVSDDDLLDMSFIDCEPETFKPSSTMSNDPFLNMLCDQNIFNNTYEYTKEDNEPDVRQEVEHEHIEEENELDVGAEYKVHDPTVKWDKMKPILGELYESPAQLRFALTNYAVSNGYQLCFMKSDKSRLLVRCGKPSDKRQCPFRIYASWKYNERTFKIKTMVDTHLCARNYKFGNLVSCEWLAKHYVKDIIRKPKFSSTDMKEDALRKFSIEVSKSQCYRAKVRAREMIEGKLHEHYARIWDYANELLISNPGSTCKVGVTTNPDGKTYFERFYICFKAFKDGWNRGCRRVIGLDGAFLKGQVKGELFIAIRRDGNNHVYPIAWAVVNVENKDNWTWFLELLVDDLGLDGGRGLVVISDQHKGLLEAVKDIMPHVEHRQCARHVLANFRRPFSSLELKNLFWAATYSTVEGDFIAKMEDIKKINEKAYDCLMSKNPTTWCRAFFSQGYACEAIENGVSESFNSMVRDIRRKPLLTMLEEIRIYMMDRFYYMGATTTSWRTEVCPAIIQKMEEFGKNMRYWRVIPSRGTVFETRYAYAAYKVDLEHRYCTCRLWEISGVPCVHAQAAINFVHLTPTDFISDWFGKAKYVATYTTNILHVNGSNIWAHTAYTKHLPPLIRRMSGRPKSKRKRHATEDKSKFPSVRATVNRTNKCSRCLGMGHNMKSCKNEQVSKDPKPPRKSGRPRREGEGPSTSKVKKDDEGTSRVKTKKMVVKRGGKSRSATRSVPPGAEQHVPECVFDLDVISHDLGEIPVGDASQVNLECDETPESVFDVGHCQGSRDMLIKDMESSVYLPDEIAACLEDMVFTEDTQVSRAKLPVKRKASQRIIKLKLKNPVYDKDGGGKTINQAITLE
ncbi:hypothetical protein LXL04_019412 [Taraxacum kok-saghyz]